MVHPRVLEAELVLYQAICATCSVHDIHTAGRARWAQSANICAIHTTVCGALLNGIVKLAASERLGQMHNTYSIL